MNNLSPTRRATWRKGVLGILLRTFPADVFQARRSRARFQTAVMGRQGHLKTRVLEDLRRLNIDTEIFGIPRVRSYWRALREADFERTFRIPLYRLASSPSFSKSLGRFDPGGPQEYCREAVDSTAGLPKTTRDGLSEQTPMRTTAVRMVFTLVGVRKHCGHILNTPKPFPLPSQVFDLPLNLCFFARDNPKPTTSRVSVGLIMPSSHNLAEAYSAVDCSSISSLSAECWLGSLQECQCSGSLG